MLKSISKKIPPNQAIIGLLRITGLLRSSSKVSRRRSRKRGPNFFSENFPTVRRKDTNLSQTRAREKRKSSRLENKTSVSLASACAEKAT